MFLKVCDTEDTHLRLVGWPKGGKKEYKKTWKVVELILFQKDKMINLDKQFESAPPPSRDGKKFAYLVSNCTECHINELLAFEGMWKSVKFN